MASTKSEQEVTNMIEELNINPVAKLKEPVDLNKLKTNGSICFETLDEDGELLNDTNENFFEDSENVSFTYEKLKFLLGESDDEDDDENNTKSKKSPFDIYAEKMTNVTKDGGVKKYILCEGKGDVVKENAIVFINYEGFLEYIPEAFDSTFTRNRVEKCILGNSQLILGLQKALLSMKVGEVSFFLFEPEYGYGKMGMLPRIPKNARTLFYVELINTTEKSIDKPMKDYENFSEVEKRNYKKVTKLIDALMEQAKDYFNTNQKVAVKKYNQAINILESTKLENMEEQIDQQKRLLRLYTNVMVCYNKINKPRRACIAFNQLKQIVKSAKDNVDPSASIQAPDFQIPAKAYFQNGRALFNIGELNLAKENLLKAKQMSPNDRQILNELMIVEKAISENKIREKRFAQALFNENNNDRNEENVKDNELKMIDLSLSDEFMNAVQDNVKLFLNSKEKNYRLPSHFNECQMNYIQYMASENGLLFRQGSNRDETWYFLEKK